MERGAADRSRSPRLRNVRRHDLAIAALLVACVADPPAEPAPTPTLAPEPTPIAPELDRIDELLLDRGGCELPCPSDLTIVDADGELWTWGRADTERRGVHHGWVTRQRVGNLAAALIDGGYPSLHSHYDSGRSHARTIMSATVVDGVRRLVVDRGHEAPEVAQQLVDGISDLLTRAEWEPAAIEPGPAAAVAPACVAFRDRVTEACMRFARDEEPEDRCRLYLSPTYATIGGALPPALCEALLASIDRAPPVVTIPPERGPQCRRYFAELAHGCAADLRGAPLADTDWSCWELLRTRSLLAVTREEDDEAREIRIRADDFWCERWSRSHPALKAYDPW